MSESTAKPTPTPQKQAPAKAAPTVDAAQAPAPVVEPEAPTVTKVAAAPVPASIAAAAANPITRQVSAIEELLGTYKNILSKPVLVAANFGEAAKIFASVMQRVLVDPAPATIDLILAFFKENQTTFLHESSALAGMEAVSKELRSRAELAYVVFRKAAAGIDVSNPMNVNQESLKNYLRCPKLIAYLASKVKLNK